MINSILLDAVIFVSNSGNWFIHNIHSILVWMSIYWLEMKNTSAFQEAYNIENIYAYGTRGNKQFRFYRIILQNNDFGSRKILISLGFDN